MLKKMLIKKRFLVYKFSRRNYLLKVCAVVCFFVLIYINLSQFILNNGDVHLLRSLDSNNELDINDPSRLFVNKISKERLDNLFRVLQNAEHRFFSSGQNKQQSSLESQLNLLSFNRIREIKLKKKQDLLNNNNNSDVKLDSVKSQSSDLYERFENEIDTFLKLEDTDRYLQATDEFVQYLENKSKNYSYVNSNPKVVGKTLHVIFQFFILS